MRLLIITQKVNEDDSILGFFHRWIIEFAKHFETVTVICLEEGGHELPANVKTLSLGKSKNEKVNSKNKIAFMRRFYGYIWRERKNYDAVFVHMNPVYVVLGGWFWKLSGKKVALWYTHKAVDLKLRVAERFVDVIFTAAEESFTLKTAKKMVVGHGIDVAAYANQPRTKVIGVEPISIISVGRITPIKDPVTLIEAARMLKDKWNKKFTVTFMGSPVTASDREYFLEIKILVDKYGLGGIVSFAGDIKPADMPAKYVAADISVNLTPTGGLDKVVLESMASGVPVLSSNKAFAPYFESAGKESALSDLAGKLSFKEGNAEDMAGKIMALCASADGLKAIGIALQKIAKEKADVSKLISRLSEALKNV